MGRGKGRIATRVVVALTLAAGIGAGVARGGLDAGIDTPYTPSARDSLVWTRVAGADFGSTRVPPSSPTTYATDLFDVTTRAGASLAGGAVCAGDSPETPTPVDDVPGCPRQPVFYRYTPTLGWEEAARFKGPGYVGAIAWIGDRTAVAVGGDGEYPREERPEDQTGRGRAWLYTDGQWAEVEIPVQLDARGMTAVDFSPVTPGWGFAGGRRQLLEWRGGAEGGFVKAYTDRSPETDVENAAGFLYRVRDIAFVPDESPIPAQVVAVTAGCCGTELASSGRAAVLSYGALLDGNREPLAGRPTGWHVYAAPPAPAGTPDSYFRVGLWKTFQTEWQMTILAGPAGPPPAAGALAPTPGQVKGPVAGSQGPRRQENGAPAPVRAELAGVKVADLRLVDADGLNSENSFDNQLLTWAVGWLPDGQAAALYSPPTERTGYSEAMADLQADCRPLAFEIELSCTPDPQGTAGEVRSDLVRLPAYRLFGVAMSGKSGSGWAVGEYGAILGLNAKAAGGAAREAAAPRLSPSDRARFAEAAPLQGAGPPPAADGGDVPALAERPMVPSAVPAFEAGGTPDSVRQQGDLDEDVTTIVMSRDGSEGWAVGPGDGGSFDSGRAMTLYHYVSGEWRRCSPQGTQGVVAPDPACESLAPLRAYRRMDGTPLPVRLIAAARVPTELDDQPANDDDFEVVAVGTPYAPPGMPERPTVLRYQRGKWALDRQAMAVMTATRLSDVAFASPDEGWVLGDAGQAPGIGAVSHAVYLYRYNDGVWTDCREAAAAGQPELCDDPGGRLPLDGVAASSDSLPDRLDLSVAGRRVYLAGNRVVAPPNPLVPALDDTDGTYPVILYRADDGRGWTDEDGGYDPAGPGASPTEADRGELWTLSVAWDGTAYQGWAIGSFGGDRLTREQVMEAGGGGPGRPSVELLDQIRPPGSSLLRLEDGAWSPWTASDAAADYLTYDVWDPNGEAKPRSNQVVSYPTPAGVSTVIVSREHPALAFSPERQRWEVLPTPWAYAAHGQNGSWYQLLPKAVAADGAGGFWFAGRQRDNGGAGRHRFVFFYRWTSQRRQPVFEDVAHPVRHPVTSMSAAADGTVVIGTAGGVVYRYDRRTGWSQRAVPGWDPGRVVTQATPITAVAVNAGGVGVAVGEGGRIADIDPTSVALDPASGVSCVRDRSNPPCGTGNDLLAAAVSPEGSAMVGGADRALLWRLAGEGFRAVRKPDAAPFADVLGISMPREDRAYLTTSTGQVFRGDREGADWQWTDETRNADGKSTALRGEDEQALRAVAVDAEGHGYAVGEGGVVLERTGDGTHPWRRLGNAPLVPYASVALTPGGGAIMGGENGLIATASGSRVRVARQADAVDPVAVSRDRSAFVRAVAAAPGLRPGDVEAWAVLQGPELSGREPAGAAVLHYTSDPAEPLLSPGGRVEPLPDAPAPRPGEVAFAAFGKQDCQQGPRQPCIELSNTLQGTARVADRLAAQVARRPDLALAVFTGDAADSAGNATAGSGLQVPTQRSVAHNRWIDRVVTPLAQQRLPVFAAIGRQDLSDTRYCRVADGGDVLCDGAAAPGIAGPNLAWRRAMATMPAPWGEGQATFRDGLALEPVASGGAPLSADATGASTHYAFDLIRDGEKAARFIFVDTSRGSLSESDAFQSPRPAEGTQERWLERVLCYEGTGPECTREPRLPAVVISTTPTYSYGPSAAGATDTAAVQTEATLLRGDASVVVSGRLGWNGLYWAKAPGLHEPCPGDPYRAAPSEDPAVTCGAGNASGAAQVLSRAMRRLGAPEVPGGASRPLDVLPFVVSAGGGRLAPEAATGGAAEGYWHGYTVVRLAADGDPSKLVVEQRPILDWLVLTASTHVVRPGQRVRIYGEGREPIGSDTPVRYDAIASPAVTHRYDLIEADPRRPWLPRIVNGNGNPNGYVPLDPSVATIDAQTGDVRAGRGNRARVFGLAVLSVGAQAASWPLVFEPRRSAAPSQQLRIVSAGVPPVRVQPLGAQSLVPPAGPPPGAPPASPLAPSLTLPATPALPALPVAGPPQAVPPPPPPAPPPAATKATALELAVNPIGLAVPPTTGVTAQPTPPVQPSPPSGARREAKQRQAATAKSEEGVSEPGQETGVDTSSGPPAPTGAAFARRDRTRASASSFSVVGRQEQRSAWVNGLQWGGGITVLALALAFARTIARPMPRRRRRDLPAPAWSRRRW